MKSKIQPVVHSSDFDRCCQLNFDLIIRILDPSTRQSNCSGWLGCQNYEDYINIY